jgi:serine/threonine-protein kinase
MNELGSIALQQGRYDEAERMYRRMEEIYRAIHDDGHYLIAVAMANRASVYMNSRRYAEAEPIFRDVIARYTRAQGADHLNTGIARIKLGRVLLRQGKVAEAAAQSLAGYEILVKQANPAISFLRAARLDLVAAYDSLGRPERAARFRAELADTAHH